jgi:hypothetical protein
MTSNSKITKDQLLKMIDGLEKNPEDKIRLLGDTGITIVGTGFGAAAAGSIAGAVGATSIFGLTAVAELVGVSVFASTPVGWIVGTAIVGGILVYGISRLIRDGGLAEGRKLELLQQYRKAVKDMAAKERADSITESDKNAFIIAIRELIDKDVIAPEEATDLIEHVEQGRIPLSQAFSMIESLLAELPSVEVKKSLSKEQIKELEYLEKAHKDGFLSDVDFEKRVNDIINAAKEQAATKEGFLSNVDFEKTAENISNAVGEKATVALDLFKDAKKGIANVDFEKTAENISNTVGEKATVALDLFKDAKKDISNVDFEKTSGNISNAVSEKATVALDLFKDAKKGIFNRFK